MKYKNIKSGIFVERPNRFIAHCEIDGKTEVCHVKNTGRCKELLIPGCRVILEKSDNPNRKTIYDLIAVYKGDVLFNIDSQAPNKVVLEWLQGFEEIKFIKPECKFENSRFDFYLETHDKKVFVEVKGVTLEAGGDFLFPDAPTDRGVRHIEELIKAKEQGYGAGIIFVVQADSVGTFYPNAKTHPQFAKALKKAIENGVFVGAFNCKVTENELCINQRLPLWTEC